VNLDATNISRPNKKDLLYEALADSKDFSLNAAHTVDRDLSVTQVSASPSPSFEGLTVVSYQVDFRQHLEVLWKTFILSYSQTNDYWPLGCSSLALQNKVLDLALVALSTQHLALDSPNSDLRLLSLTAYNTSVGLYRSHMQHQFNDDSAAILAVTSTVYALIEAALMQPEDIASFGWGKSGHFDGVLALLQRSGPLSYSNDGFHLVWKKIREMGVG
jgi:hypothetical protein